MKLLFVIISTLSLMLVTACDEAPNSDLKVGTHLWPGYEPFHLAEEKGFLKGQFIDLIELSAARDVARAMSNGSIHAATLTLDEVITLKISGVDLDIAAVLDVSHGADMVISRKPMNSLNEVKGKRIGVDTGAVGAVMLTGFLEFAGLTYQDVEIVPITINGHQPAFERADIDLIVTYEPVAGQLLRMGGHKVFDSANIPNTIADVLVVRRDVFPRYKKQVQALVDGYFKARQWMTQDMSSSLSVMASRSGDTVENLAKAYEGLYLPSLEENRVWLGRCSQYFGKRVEDLSQLMKTHNLIDALPDDYLLCNATWVEGVNR